MDNKNLKFSFGEKFLFTILVLLTVPVVMYFVWVIGYGVYHHYNPIMWSSTVEELEPGIYGYTSATVSNVPAQNYEMLTVLCNGRYMTIKGEVKIVYDSDTPYIEYESTGIVNADSVTIHAQKGQIKNSGIQQITR